MWTSRRPPWRPRRRRRCTRGLHPPALAVLGPLLNVRGLSAGGVGAATRDVVPEHATVSIDLPLAAGQDPVAALEAVAGHVVSRGFRLVDGPPSAEERRAYRRLASVDGTRR